MLNVVNQAGYKLGDGNGGCSPCQPRMMSQSIIAGNPALQSAYVF